MAARLSFPNDGDKSWLAMIAQHVPCPSLESLPSAASFFRKRRGSKFSGTWITSKSLATVTVSPASCNGLGPSIAVILKGHIHEEHLLSSLAFSWQKFQDENKQTPCQRRAILASYKVACSEKKHKFAMRFETATEAKTFLETVKELIDDHSGGSKHQQRSLQQNSFESGIQTLFLNPQNAAVGHGATSRSYTLHNGHLSYTHASKDDMSSNSSMMLPPRFPSFDVYPDRFQADFSSCKSQEGGNLAMTPGCLEDEELLKEKIKACFLDPEFQDFVNRVETIWQAIEKDLSTEMSSEKQRIC
ncbi:hypothetical protein KP509_37G023800 [Ceratopteris richardii]|uniref:Poor homologous synapsis 1 PH domain-containing protein n=1 Tax=Ceratopteris richardii TaxID=49495 RepID=A0A8T2Q7D6_CERRI|nr:hypothetical protein KP509_37G023800 [Ceratopteris richardii]